MEKLNLTKRYKTYFTAKAKAEIVMIEPARFISLEGKGDPSGKDFASHIQALYTTAYAIKFACKSLQKDFTVSKLECLWWFDESEYGDIPMPEAPLKIPRSEWEYRLMIRMPDFVTPEMVKQAKHNAFTRKKMELINSIAFFEMEEGKCVQMLHIGPFSTEPETLQEMNELMQSENFEKNGFHHEIYLSDFNKTAPEKLKTILREPVRNQD